MNKLKWVLRFGNPGFPYETKIYGEQPTEISPHILGRATWVTKDGIMVKSRLPGRVGKPAFITDRERYLAGTKGLDCSGWPERNFTITFPYPSEYLATITKPRCCICIGAPLRNCPTHGDE